MPNKPDTAEQVPDGFPAPVGTWHRITGRFGRCPTCGADCYRDDDYNVRGDPTGRCYVCG